MSEQLLQVIGERRSVRSYKPDPIPDEHIRLMLEAAMLAPSARNSRPWSFVVITNAEARETLATKHPYARFVRQAPVAFIVCGQPDKSAFWQQDCGAAIENLLLQARALGYGTCWCGVYPNEKVTPVVQEVVGGEDMPVCVIAAGVPDESPARRGFYEEAKVRFMR